jgi:hypothetical protein
MSKEGIVRCVKCFSPQMRVETGTFITDGFANLVCNDCGFREVLASKEAAQKIMEKAGFGVNDLKDSFVPKGTIQATICYNSVESASGPMTLGMLYEAVTDALEKGMPIDSEVYESSSQENIYGVRFLFETEKVEPIMCGEHIGSDPQDIIVTTHECEES